MESKNKIYIGAAIIIVLIAVFILAGLNKSGQSNISPLNQNLTVPGNQIGSSSASRNQPAQDTISSDKNNGVSNKKISPLSTGSATSYLVSVTSPISNEQWVVNEKNTISWNKAMGITGSIYLVNAGNGTIAGWITPNTTGNQTSFTWDTRYIFLSRTNPSRKEVQVGNYIIKIAFDHKPVIETQSASFSIIYPSQLQKKTYQVEISNYAFIPASLVVKQGETIVITNNDFVAQNFTGTFGGPYQLNPSKSLTIDTSLYASGKYSFYSDKYPTLKFSLTVQ